MKYSVSIVQLELSGNETLHFSIEVRDFGCVFSAEYIFSFFINTVNLKLINERFLLKWGFKKIGISRRS